VPQHTPCDGCAVQESVLRGGYQLSVLTILLGLELCAEGSRAPRVHAADCAIRC